MEPPADLADRIAIDPDTGCWRLLTPRGTPAAAPQVWYEGRPVLLRPLLYRRLVGPIPPGHRLYATCRRPWCINPAHAEPLTRSECNRRTAARLTAEQVATIRRTVHTHTNAALAVDLGLPEGTVDNVRSGRSFPDSPWPQPDPPSGPRHHALWHPDDDALLLAHPEAPAAELAIRLGRSKAAIDQRRLTLRRAGKRASRTRRWTAEEEAVLRANPGMSAAELGEMLGRTAEAVGLRRSRLRRRDGAVRVKRAWTADEDAAVLAELERPAVALAAELGRTVRAVTSRRRRLRKARE